jgi:hypothetical protein
MPRVAAGDGHHLVPGLGAYGADHVIGGNGAGPYQSPADRFHDPPHSLIISIGTIELIIGTFHKKIKHNRPAPRENTKT